MPDGMMPARNTADTASAACVYLAERHQHQNVVLGVGQQPEHHFGDDAQRALRAHHELGEVVAGGVLERVGGRPDDVAGGQHHLQIEHVVAGGAVLHGLGAAAAVGQVAAQKAAALAGRVGRIEQADVLHRLLKHLVHHARLHGGLQVALINLNDVVEPLGAQHHAVVDGQRAAAQAGARAAGVTGMWCSWQRRTIWLISSALAGRSTTSGAKCRSSVWSRP